MPTADELISSLHGAKIFSKIDLYAGYHQLSLAEESRHLNDVFYASQTTPLHPSEFWNKQCCRKVSTSNSTNTIRYPGCHEY